MSAKLRDKPGSPSARAPSGPIPDGLGPIRLGYFARLRLAARVQAKGLNACDRVSAGHVGHTPISPALRAAVLGAAAALLLLVSPPSAVADEYPLDTVGRVVPPKGKLRCPEVELVRYRGDTIRYHRPVKVFVGFRDRLRLFEQVVREAAVEVYGRAPRRIKHLGTYNCRRIRAYPFLMSEHALGNGIDIAGFHFGPARRGDEAAKRLPRSLRRSFKVRVLKHWDGRGRAGRLHARFLRELARRLAARPDIFRVMLGPGYPGHKNHFHFDCSPWRLVDGFDD